MLVSENPESCKPYQQPMFTLRAFGGKTWQILAELGESWRILATHIGSDLGSCTRPCNMFSSTSKQDPTRPVLAMSRRASSGLCGQARCCYYYWRLMPAQVQQDSILLGLVGLELTPELFLTHLSPTRSSKISCCWASSGLS